MAGPVANAEIARRDPYHPFRRTLLPAGRVRELSQLRPLRMAFDIVACWAFIVAAWTVAAALDTWWVKVIAGVVVGNRRLPCGSSVTTGRTAAS